MPSIISKLLEYKVLPIRSFIERAKWNLRCLIKKRVLCEKKEEEISLQKSELKSKH
jgi:hypothetical protein